MQGPFNFKKNTLGLAFGSHPRDPLTMTHFRPPDSKRQRVGRPLPEGGGAGHRFSQLMARFSEPLTAKLASF